MPLATVAFSFVARFPVFQQWLDALEVFLLKYTLPGSANEVVHQYVREFTEKAAALTGISIVFILIAASLVIATIEREINALWGISVRRPFARRLAVYLLGVTLGPGARRGQHFGDDVAFHADPRANAARIVAGRFRREAVAAPLVDTGARAALCDGAEPQSAVAARVCRRVDGGYRIRGHETRFRAST